MSDASDTSAAGSPPPEAQNAAGQPASSTSPNNATTTTTTATDIAKKPAGDKGKPASKKRSDSVSGSASAADAQKNTKRRAARACVSCRARKVRCDVVEQSPCGNCRWDNVEVCHAPPAYELVV